MLPPQPSLLERAMAVPKQLATRVGLYVAFIYAKQPGRVKEVLNRVYIDQRNVDDDLVRHLNLSRLSDMKLCCPLLHEWHRVTRWDGLHVKDAEDRHTCPPLKMRACR